MTTLALDVIAPAMPRKKIDAPASQNSAPQAAGDSESGRSFADHMDESSRIRENTADKAASPSTQLRHEKTESHDLASDEIEENPPLQEETLAANPHPVVPHPVVVVSAPDTLAVAAPAQMQALPDTPAVNPVPPAEGDMLAGAPGIPVLPQPSSSGAAPQPALPAAAPQGSTATSPVIPPASAAALPAGNVTNTLPKSTPPAPVEPAPDIAATAPQAADNTFTAAATAAVKSTAPPTSAAKPAEPPAEAGAAAASAVQTAATAATDKMVLMQTGSARITTPPKAASKEEDKDKDALPAPATPEVPKTKPVEQPQTTASKFNEASDQPGTKVKDTADTAAPSDTTTRTHVADKAAADQSQQLSTQTQQQIKALPPHALAQMPAAIVQIGVEMAARHRKGNTQFDIRLDPAELGRVDVRLEIDRDGKVTSRLFVEKTETLELLKADLRGLERALEQAGFRSDPGSLSLNLRDNNQAGHNSAFWNQKGGSDRGNSANDNGSPEPESAIVQVAYQPGGTAASGLDIRV
jgi:flagellar hook-length control protein FliK